MTTLISILPDQELRNMLKEGQTLYQISRQFNTTIPEIFKLGRSYGISFAYDHNNIPKPSKQDLESMYHDEQLTQRQIAKEFGVTYQSVWSWFRKYNISTVGRRGAKVPIPPKEVLVQMYSEYGMTQEQIGKEFDVHAHTVGIWLSKYNIQARVPMPPKDDLLNYIAEGFNQHQIAEKYKVCDATIFKWCEHYGIPGMVNGFRCTTPEHIEWRDKVLERDNYVCQECGSQDDLQAHHIKTHRDYTELELDVDNGITLCKQCHESIRGREHHYIIKYEDIVLRDRCIGDLT